MSRLSINEENQTTTPICTVDPYQYLQITQNEDGSITRLIDYPSTPATPDPSSPSSVLTQDIPLNTINNTYVRIFLPKSTLSLSNKLPVIVYYHGGGFVLLHADSTIFHPFCCSLASHAHAIVVSVEYRLAPEHRLPAAYDDAMDGLHFVKANAAANIATTTTQCNPETSQNDWLTKYGDFNNVFIMGTSAGGNIAYHAGLRASASVDDLQPLKIKGLILHQPFFGGSKRVDSEIRLIDDPFLPLSGSDLFWALSLPLGANRDNDFCNPVSGIKAGSMEKMGELGWRVLITGGSGDPLVDRLVELVTVLEEKGIKVKGHFTEGVYHGVEILEPSKGDQLFDVVKAFTNSCLDA